MNNPIGNVWTQADASGHMLKKRASELVRHVDRYASACAEGDLKVAGDAISELAGALQDLERLRLEAADTVGRVVAAVTAPGALEEALVEALCSAFPENNVFSSFQSLFVYPIRLSLKPGANGVDVLIRGQRTASRRPSTIANLVKEALKEARPPEQFAKALYRAFRALREGAETGRVPLPSLYEVLAAGPAGGPSFSTERFTQELQALYVQLGEPVSLTSSLRLHREDFSTADAARGYQIYLPDGSSIVLGYVYFGVKSGAPE